MGKKIFLTEEQLNIIIQEELGIAREVSKASSELKNKLYSYIAEGDNEGEFNFLDIKHEIEEQLKDLILGIEHIGSTSVEGMYAKPCIDLDVIIKDYSVFDIVVKKLALIGYIHEGNLGIKDREAFTYNNKEHLQKTYR